MRNRVATYIWKLPVDQRFTCAAGHGIWGFPKSVEQIAFEDVGGRRRCRLVVDGRHVLTFSVSRGGGRTLPDAPWRPTPTSTACSTARRSSPRDGRWDPPGRRELVLGDHPLAAELGSLGLPKGALMSVWMEHSHGRFEAPRHAERARRRRSAARSRRAHGRARARRRRLERQADQVAELQGRLAAAKKEKKPICLIFYTEWCPHCANYSAVFHDPKVVDTTKRFVMIRLDKDKEAELSKKYAPDGEYIPRTYFLSSAGVLDADIHAPRDSSSTSTTSAPGLGTGGHGGGEQEAAVGFESPRRSSPPDGPVGRKRDRTVCLRRRDFVLLDEERPVLSPHRNGRRKCRKSQVQVSPGRFGYRHDHGIGEIQAMSSYRRASRAREGALRPSSSSAVRAVEKAAEHQRALACPRARGRDGLPT